MKVFLQMKESMGLKMKNYRSEGIFFRYMYFSFQFKSPGIVSITVCFLWKGEVTMKAEVTKNVLVPWTSSFSFCQLSSLAI